MFLVMITVFNRVLQSMTNIMQNIIDNSGKGLLIVFLFLNLKQHIDYIFISFKDIIVQKSNYSRVLAKNMEIFRCKTVK
jgi:hypothetical protein